MGYTNFLKIRRAFIVLVLFISLTITGTGFCQGPEIKMNYLDSRMKTIRTHKGEKLTIWKTDNPELIARGVVASTLETALVTRAYLQHYRLFKKPESLEKAKKGIRFIIYMQAKNGCFYNYLLESGFVDSENPKSRPTLDEHTAHSFVAMARLLSKFKGSAAEYRSIEDSFMKTYDRVVKYINNPKHKYGDYIKFQKTEFPAWLIRGRGDLTAIYLMGMAHYCEKSTQNELSKTAEKLARGIIEFKNDNPKTFPMHAHLSFVTHPWIWKTENAFQVAALSLAGRVFDKDEWINEALEEGIGFQMHLPASYGPIDGFYPHPDVSPQSPLAAYTLVRNFSELARSAKDGKIWKVAGICGAWFYRNNPASHPVYHNDDGSCYKEIRGNDLTEEKSLLGSACALLALMELHRSEGFEYLGYKAEKVHTYQLLESEKGRPVNTDFEVADWEYTHGGKGKVVIIRRRNTFWHKFKVDVEDEYFLMMSFQKQLLYSSAVAVNVRIDGGPILLVPLGGAINDPYMIMQRVIEPVLLTPGLHTVGVRYKGLLYTKPAIIDCTVLQPVLERKWFVNNIGKRFMLVKNWMPERKKMRISKKLRTQAILVEVSSIKGHNIKDPVKTIKGKDYLFVPTSGFAVVEW